MTKGSAHKVNIIFDPGNSNLTVIMDINNPIKRLENTTATNTETVLKSSPKTSQD